MNNQPTMIEKIARGLARATLTPLGKKHFDDKANYYDDCFSQGEKEKFIEQAKAALEAMKEPSEGMVKEGAMGGWPTPEICFRVMIEAALKE